MKDLISIIAALLFCLSANAQYTLEQCQNLAKFNYPLIKQYELIEKVAEYDVQNAKRAWLPQISLSGQATYQSDVTSFPTELTDIYSQAGISINPLHKDQYRIALDIKQNIWDGGYTKAQTEAAEAEKELGLLTNDADLYALESRINQIYFGILTLREQAKQAELRESLLRENYKSLEGASMNGAATESDLYLIEAELLINEQFKKRISSSKASYIQVLALMTGVDIPEDAEFEKPSVQNNTSFENNRPELQVFDAQTLALNAQKRAVNSMTMPQFSFFAQGLYGNPGLNMFQDMMEYKWRWNYIVGLRFQWNISSFYTQKNRLRSIEAQQSRITVQKDRFIYENNLQRIQADAATRQMYEIMQEDESIIELRTKIREASEAKWRNGVITTTELLKDINNEANARLEKSMHELEWLKNIYEIKTITNN